MDIDELIDWAATGIEVSMCCACGCTGEECEGCTWLPDIVAKKTAKQILSHPNLYLEVDGDLTDWGKYTLVRFSYWGMNPKGEPKYLIPLAEAITET